MDKWRLLLALTLILLIGVLIAFIIKAQYPLYDWHIN